MGRISKTRAYNYFKSIQFIRDGDKENALNHLLLSAEDNCLIALKTLELVYLFDFKKWGIEKSTKLSKIYGDRARTISPRF